MPFRSWPFRRIAALWIAGMALEVGLYVGLALFTRYVVSRDMPRVAAQVAAANARDDQQDRASAASREAQVRVARATGEFTVGPRGDTTFAVVTTPSGRTSPGRRAELLAGTRRAGGVLALILFGSIPVALLVVTATWAFGQRAREPQPG